MVARREKPDVRIHWHRRDLRLADNRGLSLPAGDPVGVFVLDDAILDHAGTPRVAFLLDALLALRKRYREHGSELLIRRGDPASILPALAAEFGADAVSWNRDYSGLARRRDDGVEAALSDAGPELDVRTFHDAICHPPGSITTNDGEPYSVYSYFWRKWRDREKDDPRPVPNLAGVDADAGEVPSVADTDVPAAGPDVARELLSSFLDGPIFEYADRRNFPADGRTSRLSPQLKFGTIGIREVDERVRRIRDAVDGERRESVEAFRSQLAWREFYAHVLAFNPEVVTENYWPYENEIEWENDPELLAAWKRGETGYPIVDAGMRQLRTEAHVHNRVRMIVASFLTKDLLVDWRCGYAHFRELLADHDAANDSGGWQWAASTGTDAQPYFRIFNPTTQGERYDPDAEYIKEHVPELREVDPAAIHDWTALSPKRRGEIALGYPAPIVDHAERRELALATFERARGESDASPNGPD